jgi:hypothetical protein
MYTHMARSTRTRALHARALVATHMRAYVRHATRVIRTKTTIYNYTRVAIYRLGSDTGPGAECMQRAAESAARARRRMRTYSQDVHTRAIAMYACGYPW